MIKPKIETNFARASDRVHPLTLIGVPRLFLGCGSSWPFVHKRVRGSGAGISSRSLILEAHKLCLHVDLLALIRGQLDLVADLLEHAPQQFLQAFHPGPGPHSDGELSFVDASSENPSGAPGAPRTRMKEDEYAPCWA